VAAVRDVVDLTDVLAWYESAMGELDAVLDAAGAIRTGPPGGLYDNELFTEERGAMVVYVPVANPPTGGAVKPFIIPAVDLATTMHVGTHDDINVTYGALGTYVSQQALAVAGPVREIYHIGPRDTDDDHAWRTEIGWPVFQTAAAKPIRDPKSEADLRSC
jgi:effector-binding domain-containing protein